MLQLEHTPASPAAHMDLLRASLEMAYPGYPARSSRFIDTAGTLGQMCLTIPDGPWAVDSHSNRPDTQTVPSAAVQDQLLDTGLRLDTLGRPLHPWLERMATDPTLGVVSGKGAYWSWGPNYTADAVVLHREQMLLIQRRDTCRWALPGGFLDTNEPAEHAARRELREETGLVLPPEITGTVVYSGPIADLRVTAHAWPETTAIAYHLADTQEVSMVEANDDALAAAWIPFSEIKNYLSFGSHQLLARLALAAQGISLDELRNSASV